MYFYNRFISRKRGMFTCVVSLLLFTVSGLYAQAPANDDRANATAITFDVNGEYCSGNAVFTNVDATADGTKPANWTQNVLSDVWFSFVATSSEEVSIEVKTSGVEGTLQYPRLALTDASGTVLEAVEWAGQFVDVGFSYDSLTDGNTYYIVVDQATNETNRTGTFTLCVTDQGTHDLKERAMLITLDGNGEYCSSNAQFTNAIGSADYSKPSNWVNDPYTNVWFQFEAPSSGEVSISLKTGGVEGTLQFPRLALYDDSFNEVVSADYSGQNVDIGFSATVTASQTYYIAVDLAVLNNNWRGSFTLCVSDEGTNDLFANATTLSLDVNGDYTSANAAFTNAIGSGDLARPSNWANDAFANVWFKFQAPASKEVAIELKVGGSEGTLQFPRLALYKADSSEIESVEYESQTGDIGFSVKDLVANDWYYIAVDQATLQGNRRGSFTLNIEDTATFDLQNRPLEITLDAGGGYCSVDAEYSLNLGSGHAIKPPNWSSNPMNEVWFKFRPITNDDFDVTVKIGGSEGTLQFPRIAVYQINATDTSHVTSSDHNGQLSDLTLTATDIDLSKDYLIAVDVGNAQTNRRGTFTLCINQPFTNDTVLGVIDVTNLMNGCSGNAVFTNASATADGTKPSNWNSALKANVWFSFTATATEEVALQVNVGGVEGTLQFPRIALFDANLNELKSVDHAGEAADVGFSHTQLQKDSLYYVAVDQGTNEISRAGTFTLCISDQASHDIRENATAISFDVNGEYCSSDAEFTTAIGSPDGTKPSKWTFQPKTNVWFQFVATATEQVAIDLKIGGAEGSLQFPRLALYDNQWNEIESIDYAQQNADIGFSAVGLDKDSTYYIVVDEAVGAFNRRGSFTLCVSENVTNDFRVNATEITLDGNGEYCSTNAEFTTNFGSGDQSRPSGWTNDPFVNVWFKFEATATEEAAIEVKVAGAEGTMSYPRVALYRWDSTVVQSVNYEGETGDVGFSVTDLIQDSTYFISVDQSTLQSNRRGSFTLCISDNATNDYRLNATAITLDTNGDYCSGDAALSLKLGSGDHTKPSNWAANPRNNIWYSFSPTTTDDVDITVKVGGTEGDSQFMRLALYNSSFVEVASKDHVGENADNTMTVAGLDASQTYYISVDGANAQTQRRGTFTLCVDQAISGGGSATNANNLGEFIEASSLTQEGALSPNPVSRGQEVRIKLTGVEGPVKVLLSDHAGRLVHEVSVTPVKNELRLQTKGMKTGLYLIRLEYQGLNKTLKLLVKD